MAGPRARHGHGRGAGRARYRRRRVGRAARGGSGMTELPPLTWLYVPASRPDRVLKALASGAHAVIVDLEDGTAAADKEQARAGLAELFHERPAVRTHVRVNALGTRWAEDDLAAVRGLAIDGVHVPKVESPDLPSVGELELHCLV